MTDWIKVRSSLVTNPRVTRMARVLLRDPEFVTWMSPGTVTCDADVTSRVTPQQIQVVTRIVVGTLVPVWSMVNDTAAGDGIVRHASSQEIDQAAGVPGFGRALIAVEWMEELPNEEGVRFINFEEHNSPQKERSLTSKSGAQRQAEYRERKKRELGWPDSRDVSDVTGDKAGDVTVTSPRDDREEKKREEKKRKKGAKAPLSADLPTWMQSLVDLYHEVLPELPGVVVMSPERQQALRDFRDWVLTSKRGDGTPRATNDDELLAWTREYFDRARLNDFIMGRGKKSPGHENWRCSIEYLLSAKGMQKVIEQTEVPA